MTSPSGEPAEVVSPTPQFSAEDIREYRRRAKQLRTQLFIVQLFCFLLFCSAAYFMVDMERYHRSMAIGIIFAGFTLFWFLFEWMRQKLLAIDYFESITESSANEIHHQSSLARFKWSEIVLLWVMFVVYGIVFFISTVIWDGAGKQPGGAIGLQILFIFMCIYSGRQAYVSWESKLKADESIVSPTPSENSST